MAIDGRKRILVTGATGFLGFRAAKHFRESMPEAEVLSPDHATLDITDFEGVSRYFQTVRPDAVLHCAAVSDTAACEKDPLGSEKTNVEGSVNIARVAWELGAACLLCSSDQVYFERGKGSAGTSYRGWQRPHTEEEDLRPANVYGRQKLEMEQRALAANPACVCLRLSWMYDVRSLARKEHGDFFRSLVERLRAGGPLSYPVYDKRGITDVMEVVHALPRAFNLPGGVYNFGSENPFSTYETVRRLLEALGQKDALLRLSPDKAAFSDEPRNLSMDLSKLRLQGSPSQGLWDFPQTLDALIMNLRTVLGCPHP